MFDLTTDPLKVLCGEGTKTINVQQTGDTRCWKRRLGWYVVILPTCLIHSDAVAVMKHIPIHPNIVPLLYFDKNEDVMCLYMPLYDGTLMDIIQER